MSCVSRGPHTLCQFFCTFLPRRVWNGIFAVGERDLKTLSLRRDRKSETTNARIGRKSGHSTSERSIAGFGRLRGGRTRARTWDPLIKLLNAIVQDSPCSGHRCKRSRNVPGPPARTTLSRATAYRPTMSPSPDDFQPQHSLLKSKCNTVDHAQS
jgi:hypothetical protein